MSKERAETQAHADVFAAVTARLVAMNDTLEVKMADRVRLSRLIEGAAQEIEARATTGSDTSLLLRLALDHGAQLETLETEISDLLEEMMRILAD